MTIKTKKPSAAERQNKRLKKQLEQQHELREHTAAQHAAFRANAAKQLAGYLASTRAAEHTLASNNVTIQELQDQVAVQCKMLAEAQSDGAQAISKYNKTAQRINEVGHILAEERRAYDALDLKLEFARAELTAARQRLAYRVWRLMANTYHAARTRLKVEYAHRRQHLVNWWMVRRLNKARVTAMNEAGYIPEKLIKIAHKYWEADQARAAGDQWTEVITPAGPHMYPKPVPLWHRIRIWMGRA